MDIGQSAYPWLGMHSFWPLKETALKALGLPEEIAVVLPCPCGDRPNRRNHWFQHQPLFDEQQEPQPSYQSSPGKKYFAKITNFDKRTRSPWSRIFGILAVFYVTDSRKFQQMFEFDFLSNLTKFELIQTTFVSIFQRGNLWKKSNKCFLNGPFFEKLKIKAF